MEKWLFVSCYISDLHPSQGFCNYLNLASGILEYKSLFCLIVIIFIHHIGFSVFLKPIKIYLSSFFRQEENGAKADKANRPKG